MLLKAKHVQFNRKSDIFRLPIRTFQGRSFPDRSSKGSGTLGTRMCCAILNYVSLSMLSHSCSAEQLNHWHQNWSALKGTYGQALVSFQSFQHCNYASRNIIEREIYMFFRVLRCFPFPFFCLWIPVPVTQIPFSQWKHMQIPVKTGKSQFPFYPFRPLYKRFHKGPVIKYRGGWAMKNWGWATIFQHVKTGG